MLTRDEVYKLAKDTAKKEAEDLDKFVDTKIEIISKLIEKNIKNLRISIKCHELGEFDSYKDEIEKVIKAITKKLITKYHFDVSNNMYSNSNILNTTIKISWGPKQKSTYWEDCEESFYKDPYNMENFNYRG